jgi:hypothetical protein
MRKLGNHRFFFVEKSYHFNMQLEFLLIAKIQLKILFSNKYDKQDQQGKAAFNERKPHMTQQQEPKLY